MLGEAQGSKTCHIMVGACTCVSIKRCQLCGPQPALAGEVSCLYPFEFTVGHGIPCFYPAFSAVPFGAPCGYPPIFMVGKWVLG